ncbi:hypothetical protein FO519_010265 [Halicephalobus sp. NKZ332]|nr:hypothetical protein FO519_010265 [Halicephalobus sp. NKZ332]
MTVVGRSRSLNRIHPTGINGTDPKFPETSSIEDSAQQQLQYRVNDIPEWKQCILLGLQQTMICFSGCLIAPYLVSEIACAGIATTALRVRLISSAFIVTGVTTFMQSALGLRLAILQGPSFTFLPPLFAFASLPEIQCNATSSDIIPEEIYLENIRTIQGSLMLSSLSLILLGSCGLIGVIARYIGPVTICPLLILLCVGNVHVIVEKAEMHWISIA